MLGFISKSSVGIKENLQANPWKTISSREVYKNSWIRVREDQVIRPDGNPGIYGVVEARLAVAVLAVDAEQQIVLVGQFRYPLQNYSWELIEGGSEDQEQGLETAKRELEEEAGLTAGQWEPLGHEIHLSNSFSAERGVIFVARDLTEVARRPEPTEILQVRRFSLAAVLAMIASGEITDSLTIIAIMLWQQKNKQ